MPNKKVKPLPPLSSRVQDFMYQQKAAEIKYHRRIEQFKQQEKCLLVLATSLSCTRIQLDMSWGDISQALDGNWDKGHLHRIANRQKGLSLFSYERLSKAINSLRSLNGLPVTHFPQFPASRSVGG